MLRLLNGKTNADGAANLTEQETRTIKSMLVDSVEGTMRMNSWRADAEEGEVLGAEGTEGRPVRRGKQARSPSTGACRGPQVPHYNHGIANAAPPPPLRPNIPIVAPYSLPDSCETDTCGQDSLTVSSLSSLDK